MKIFIASDHAAYEAKEELANHLRSHFEVENLGTFSKESTDYPHWALRLVREVQAHGGYGVLLCGSGIGVSMVANRYRGIRAALCRDEDDATMARRHNNANVICLSGRKTSLEQLKKMVDLFLKTEFDGGRHQTRIDQFNQLGE
jgi:ribose 5-phosphate isomerase B